MSRQPPILAKYVPRGKLVSERRPARSAIAYLPIDPAAPPRAIAITLPIRMCCPGCWSCQEYRLRSISTPSNLGTIIVPTRQAEGKEANCCISYVHMEESGVVGHTQWLQNLDFFLRDMLYCVFAVMLAFYGNVCIYATSPAYTCSPGDAFWTLWGLNSTGGGWHTGSAHTACPVRHGGGLEGG